VRAKRRLTLKDGGTIDEAPAKGARAQTRPMYRITVAYVGVLPAAEGSPAQSC
jgi:hypothetical protein